jgi:hypothetical protein
LSGDEMLVLMLSAVVALVAWVAWYVPVARVRGFGLRTTGRGVMGSSPLVAGLILFGVLKTAAAHDVRDDPRYLFFYMLLGAAWVGLGLWAMPLLGVSPRDDVLERGNRAASFTIAGALVALTLCFAGGNVGDGPGWWVVVFSAALATAALASLWLALDAIAGVTDVITVERDPAAGVRAAGFLVATAAVLGRAVAGDWVSAAATLRDFAVYGWPALALFTAAALLESGARPTPARPVPAVGLYGVLPAALYLGAAALYLYRLGSPT